MRVYARFAPPLSYPPVVSGSFPLNGPHGLNHVEEDLRTENGLTPTGALHIQVRYSPHSSSDTPSPSRHSGRSQSPARPHSGLTRVDLVDGVLWRAASFECDGIFFTPFTEPARESALLGDDGGGALYSTTSRVSPSRSASALPNVKHPQWGTGEEASSPTPHKTNVSSSSLKLGHAGRPSTASRLPLNSQEEVYARTCGNFLRRNLLNGEEAASAEIPKGSSRTGPMSPLVYLCYGATGTGKTYTLFGPIEHWITSRSTTRADLEEPSSVSMEEFSTPYTHATGSSLTGLVHSQALQHCSLAQRCQLYRQGEPHPSASLCVGQASGLALVYEKWWSEQMRSPHSGIVPRYLLDLFQSSPTPPPLHRRQCVVLSCAEHGLDGVVDLISLALQEETKRCAGILGAGPVAADPETAAVLHPTGQRVLRLMEEAALRYEAWAKVALCNTKQRGTTAFLTTNACGIGWSDTGRLPPVVASLLELQEGLTAVVAAEDVRQQKARERKESYWGTTASQRGEVEDYLLRCTAFYQPSHYKPTMASPHLWQRLKGLLFTSAETCWCVLHYVLLGYRVSRPTPVNPSGSSRTHLLLRLQEVFMRPSGSTGHFSVPEVGREALFVDLAGSEKHHAAAAVDVAMRGPSRPVTAAERDTTTPHRCARARTAYAVHRGASHPGADEEATPERYTTPSFFSEEREWRRSSSRTGNARRARSATTRWSPAATSVGAARRPSPQSSAAGEKRRVPRSGSGSLRETQHINTSLLVLRRVVQAWARLSRQQQQQQQQEELEVEKQEARMLRRVQGFIPFKENPLTAILEPFFVYNSQRRQEGHTSHVVLMICCSSEAQDFSESVISLRLGTQATTVTAALPSTTSASAGAPSGLAHSTPRLYTGGGASGLPVSGPLSSERALPQRSPSPALMVSPPPTPSPLRRDPLRSPDPTPVPLISIAEDHPREPGYHPDDDELRRLEHSPVRYEKAESDTLAEGRLSSMPVTAGSNSSTKKSKYYENLIQMLYQQCLKVTEQFNESVEDLGRTTALLQEKHAENQQLREEVRQLRKALEEARRPS